jgi:hypothetical protein
MTSEYPREAQNPPTRSGARPDQQPQPEVRVPDDDPDVESMSPDERLRRDPKRTEVLPPVKGDERGRQE